MKLPRARHRWNLTPKEAIALQKQWAPRVEQITPKTALRLVAGLDAAFTPDGKNCIAAVVLWDAYDKKVIEQHVAVGPVYLPYIPGLLSFREIPALLKALRKLKVKPDSLMCDGQGLAHPRRFGIASHLGVFTDMASIGCGKSLLIGEYTEPDTHRGAFTNLMHKNEIIGAALRTKNQVKPVFVSIGHKIDLNTAVKTVLQCTLRHRLPEPTRLADKLVALAKKR